ncbi:MAG TPA: hypothetical protein DCS93_26715 [Microscillaceae bacterium]|nr:hypothetical protein [Microscillaceae bacterium]
MRKTKSIWLVVVGSLIFSACASKEKQKAVAKRRYCPNAYLLFAASDSIKKISTIGEETSIEFGKALEDRLQVDLCDHPINFGIQLNPQFAVSVWVEKDYKVFKGFPVLPKVELWEIPSRVLVLNREYIARDSVKWGVLEALSGKTKEYEQLRTSIRWSIPFPTEENLTKLIYQVLDGYLLAYGQLAQKYYHKSFCELNPKQITHLSKELPFALFIAVHRLPTLFDEKNTQSYRNRVIK